jgi:hypothetical protein
MHRSNRCSNPVSAEQESGAGDRVSSPAFLWLAALHGVLLLVLPSVALIAVGLCWNSNTISHNFIHRPFFRSRRMNLMFSAYLSVLLGIPQVLWRERHLAHHRGARWRLRGSSQLFAETALVLGLWASLAVLNAHFFLTVYIPGYFAGLALCALQGYYEHASSVTSHYGAFYNFLCFNDGYHAEHHAHPGTQWTQLPRYVLPGVRTSRWPALLRWLDGLERIVLRSTILQSFVLASHRKAFRNLLPFLPATRRVLIVGGGLFPRTALILRELLPGARIEIMDKNAANLESARQILGCGVHYIHGRFTHCNGRYDLIVIPLAYDECREAIYRNPPAPAILVHDWIWQRHGRGQVVSAALLKRLNLITL